MAHLIRPAEAADVPAVTALWNYHIRETLVTFNSAEKTEDEVADYIDDKTREGYTFLVAGPPGAPVGFVTYGQFRGGVGYGRTMEHSILIERAAHGRGLGRALMAAIEYHARARGAHSMFAGVSAENPAGRAFHMAVGYELTATLREVGWKWERGIDLWLMQKIL